MISKHTTNRLLFVCCLLVLSRACQIAGKEIGSCIAQPLLTNSFCGSLLSEYACAPSFNQTWSQYDAAYKDAQIKFNFLTYVQAQLIKDYQSSSSSTLVLANNIDCLLAYKNFICQWNFPTCDPTTDTTIQPCLSLCVSYYKQCKGSADACSIIWSNQDGGLNVSC